MTCSQIVLASHNAGKLREFQDMLGHRISLLPVSRFTSSEPEETGLTFIENAILKARFAASCSGLPALADDSGLAVKALAGAPGIRSARFAGTGGDTANNQKLLQSLENAPENGRAASFICVLAFLRHAEDPVPIICEGIWPGTILKQPRGSNGFGYDPVFQPDDCNGSSAELSPEQKNRLSHRARAVALLKQRLGL